MLTPFTGPLADAQGEPVTEHDPWSEQQRLKSERTRLAIAIILGGRRRRLDDAAIRRELARHGLTWDDCDF